MNLFYLYLAKKYGNIKLNPYWGFLVKYLKELES